ncbi:hypothetical protein L3X38_042823 [Prunus dulcis]|uniref:Uncharacterized protein n=1 Tax=Prunus dulcis TaxID=3755 RepID=A0AAD4UX98_PRUDU|nr:hypothetical protein L3X38_042823 [Prunus dulcis]
MRCKFNHPKDKLAAAVPSENSNVFALPERPSELPCAFYLKMGQSKQENKIGEIGTTIHLEGTGFSVKPPALSFNSKGLPVSPGEPDCPFYLKTGSCNQDPKSDQCLSLYLKKDPESLKDPTTSHRQESSWDLLMELFFLFNDAPWEGPDLISSDVVWSNSSITPDLSLNIEKGICRIWCPDCTEKFLNKFQLKLIIRSHEGSDARENRTLLITNFFVGGMRFARPYPRFIISSSE